MNKKNCRHLRIKILEGTKFIICVDCGKKVKVSKWRFNHLKSKK